MSGRSHSGHKEKRGTRYYLERWLFHFSFSLSFFFFYMKQIASLRKSCPEAWSVNMIKGNCI